MSYRQAFIWINTVYQNNNKYLKYDYCLLAFKLFLTSVTDDLQILGPWYARQGFAQDNDIWKWHSLDRN